MDGVQQLTELRRAWDETRVPKGWPALLKAPTAAFAEHAVKTAVSALAPAAMASASVSRGRRNAMDRLALLEDSSQGAVQGTTGAR